MYKVNVPVCGHVRYTGMIVLDGARFLWKAISFSHENPQNHSKIITIILK